MSGNSEQKEKINKLYFVKQKNKIHCQINSQGIQKH